MKFKKYVVACNAEPNGIVIAESKKKAIELIQKQADEDFGEGNCDTHWEAYEFDSYFTDDDYGFFGWIQSPGQHYLE